MGTILTVASSKGGSGKTTLATILGVALASRGQSIAMLDADPNATLSDWLASNYEGPSLASEAEKDHVAIIERAYGLAEKHAVVVIDTAGFANLTAASAIAQADAVLIPCMADRGSVREAMRTAAQVASLGKAARRSIPYRVVLSQWSARGLAEAAARADLDGSGVACLATAIPALASVKQFTFTGSLPTSGRLADVSAELLAELDALKFTPRQRKPQRKEEAAS
jgi:chromosome partitioning protein